MIQSMKAIFGRRVIPFLSRVDRQHEMRRALAVQIHVVFGDREIGRGGGGLSGGGVHVESREAAAVYHRANPVAALEQVTGGPQIDCNLIDPAGLEQRRAKRPVMSSRGHSRYRAR